MKEIVLASHNPKKKGELEALLRTHLPHLKALTLDEICDLPDVEEDGKTFAENAAKKAVSAARATGRWALGDDSGLSVDALGGRPGVRSARYGGEPRDSNRNNAKLLQDLMGLPADRRAAHFVCALALADPAGEIRLRIEGRCDGTILDAPRGQGGFGYDPLFYYPPLGKTFAELAPEEKHRVSHRGKAMRELAEALRELARP